MTKVKIKPGFVESSGRQITDLNDALKKEADCGCGIDCCNGWIVLTDQVTGVQYQLGFFLGLPAYREVGSDEWIPVGDPLN